MMLTLLFALTMFVGSALLFSVQPMVAKMILPLLGGSPEVWNTCMVFYQAVLLAGYAYAHLATARLGARTQSALHVALLLLPLPLLPLAVPEWAARSLSPTADPTPWLLGVLLTTVGLPFFVVSTTAPLLQRWFAATGHHAAGDPYFLYGASNLGSMLALLAYPLAIEPSLPLGRQCKLWAAGYGLLAALTVACAATVWRTRGAIAPGGRDESGGADPARPGPRRWLEWGALAFVPSSLMLGVTTYLTTDIAAIPLLWVIPLALYLLTFILAFTRRPILPHRRAVRAFPFVVMALLPALCAGLVQPFWLPVHLLTFFLAAMVCHGELARRRPPARDLTAFYLALALGGVAGGIFNALIAPRAFDRVAEYPLAIVLACACWAFAIRKEGEPRLRTRDMVLALVVFGLTAALVTDVRGLAETPLGALGVMIDSGLVILVAWAHRERPLRFALVVGALLLACGMSPGVNGRLLHQERSFFGVLRVTEVQPGNYHRLFHGSTLHGQQCLDPDRRREPLSYFTRSGPIGRVFAAYNRRPASPSVAIVGLGAGSLAAYAEPGQRWTFYEIDPAVVRVARDRRYFTFLEDCRATSLEVVLGDARLRLDEAPDRGYGLIVLDAFSSDAPPVHLLTREAFRLYRRKLAEGGLLAFNISNRYLDLDPVLGALARDAGLACRVRYDTLLTREQRQQGKQSSIWVVMAARPEDLGPLAGDPDWKPPRGAGAAVWTDDYAGIGRHLVFRPR
jgi:SAM-dependent methyltransferase